MHLSSLLYFAGLCRHKSTESASDPSLLRYHRKVKWRERNANESPKVFDVPISVGYGISVLVLTATWHFFFQECPEVLFQWRKGGSRKLTENVRVVSMEWSGSTAPELGWWHLPNGSDQGQEPAFDLTKFDPLPFRQRSHECHTVQVHLLYSLSPLSPPEKPRQCIHKAMPGFLSALLIPSIKAVLCNCWLQGNVKANLEMFVCGEFY